LTKAIGLVQTGVRQCEFEEFPLPVLGEGEVLVRVEANGICASDVPSYNATDFYWKDGTRRILGHEIVGIVEDMGPKTRNRDHISPGDRVCVYGFVVCGTCPACLRGDSQGCSGFRIPLHYGVVPTSVAPGLWGGYATHCYVPANGVLYKMPSDVNALDATLWNPLSGGYEWGINQGGIKPGDKVLIMGAGQRGLAAIFPTLHAGADFVALTGLSKDDYKLALALEFGANAVCDVEKNDPVEWAHEVTGGTGFDVILDMTPHAVQPLVDAVEMVKRMGTIVVIGLKMRPLNDFPIDRFLFKRIRMQGWVGQNNDAMQFAADLVASKKYPLHKMRTHVFGFDQLGLAIDTLTGDVPGEKAINVVVTPTMSASA